MKLYENGAYLLNGKEVIIDGPEAQAAVKARPAWTSTNRQLSRRQLLTVF